MLRIKFFILLSTVDCGCRIHRLYLCRGGTQQNECPRYDIKLFEALGNVAYSFIAIAPSSGAVALEMNKIELFDISQIQPFHI